MGSFVSSKKIWRIINLSDMVQTLITYIIIALVAFLVCRHLWKILKPPKKDVPTACAGCPLAEACQKSKIEPSNEKKRSKEANCTTKRSDI